MFQLNSNKKKQLYNIIQKFEMGFKSFLKNTLKEVSYA